MKSKQYCGHTQMNVESVLFSELEQVVHAESDKYQRADQKGVQKDVPEIVQLQIGEAF